MTTNAQLLDAAIAASVEALQAQFGEAPAVAVVLGSGWSGAVSRGRRAALALHGAVGLPAAQVEGHVSEVVVGSIGAQRDHAAWPRAPTRAATAPAWPAPSARSGAGA